MWEGTDIEAKRLDAVEETTAGRSGVSKFSSSQLMMQRIVNAYK